MIIDSETQVTPAVLDSMGRTADPRLREITEALVRHLHEFAREVRPTQDEFERGVAFVTRMGQETTDTHNEVILASDVFGLSTLIGLLNNPAFAGETEAALLGPFWREGSPELPLGASLLQRPTAGAPVLVRGQVSSSEGSAIAAAVVDVWHADPAGFYDNQDPSLSTMNLRGRFRTDAEGHFHFTTVRPAGYPVPMHGPVGALLRTQQRDHHRPAHLHFMVSAPGRKTLVTQVFADDAEHLQSDVTFSVMRTLVARFAPQATTAGAPAGFSAPWFLLEYDFVLPPGDSRLPTPPIK